MKKYLLLVALAISSVFSSCTDNQMARNYGGTEEVTLQDNHELLNVTWKQDDMWIITKDTTTNICYAQEKSSWGLLEGTIVLNPPTKLQTTINSSPDTFNYSPQKQLQKE